MNFINTVSSSIWTGYIFTLGLVVGSFLNVCIYRLPRKASVITPRSRCPSCNSVISIRDNIPILSYILLGGKCRHCKESISPIYPAIEILTALFLTAVFLKFGLTAQAGVYGVTLSALVVITMIDIKYRIIPDSITLPGIAFGFIAGSYLNGFFPSFIGFLLGGVLFYLLALVSKGGMGGGDIKLIAALGALLGWQKVLLVIFLGSLIGTIYSFPFLLSGKKCRKSLIPFGPFLAVATGLAIFIGKELIIIYLQYMSR